MKKLRLINIDETGYFILGAFKHPRLESYLSRFNTDFVKRLGEGGKIFSQHIFDIESHTYCCEIFPSYEMHFVRYFFQSSLEFSEKELEEIDCILSESGPDCDVSYHHARDIDNLYLLQANRNFIEQEFEDIEEGVEYYRCNCRE